jgi:hypothetical protein
MGNLQCVQPGELRHSQSHLRDAELRPHLQRQERTRDAVRPSRGVLIWTQIDGFPSTPADTARLYIPITAFDQTTCRQAGATANCVDVGGSSSQPRNNFRYDDSFSVDFGLVRSIPTVGSQRARVRLEVFNLFDKHYAGLPRVSFALPDNFGRVFGTNTNRSWQIALRYDW